MTKSDESHDFSWSDWKKRFFEVFEATLDTGETSASEHPEPAWGEPIPTDRQEYLFERVTGEISHAVRPPGADSDVPLPFYDEPSLSGGDAFWLATRYLAGRAIETPMLPIERLSAEIFEVTKPLDTKFDMDSAAACLLAATAFLLGMSGQASAPALSPAERKALALFLDLIDFSQLYLGGADFSNSDLRGAVLPQAHFEACRFTGKSLLTGAYLRQAEFFGAKCGGAHLEATVLRRANLSSTELQSCKCQAADLAQAVLHEATVSSANLAGARLSQAVLTEANLVAASLVGADLSGADLSGAILANARLSGAILTGADLHGSQLGGVHTDTFEPRDPRDGLGGWPSEPVAGADLAGRELSDDELGDVRSFVSDFPAYQPATDLRGASFNEDTRLSGATLTRDSTGMAFVADLRWDGVDLTGLDWDGAPRLGDDIAASAALHSQASRTSTQGESALELFQNATRANRQLAVALRSNGITDVADEYSYRAHCAQRAVYRLSKRRGKQTLSTLLWILAGYGYRPSRVVIAYVTVVSVFALLFGFLHYSGSAHLSAVGAVVLSVTSFHGRGFFAGQLPLDSPDVVLSAIEAVVGLLIEVTFIAAFTQRFLTR